MVMVKNGITDSRYPVFQNIAVVIVYVPQCIEYVNSPQSNPHLQQQIVIVYCLAKKNCYSLFGLVFSSHLPLFLLPYTSFNLSSCFFGLSSTPNHIINNWFLWVCLVLLYSLYISLMLSLQWILLSPKYFPA